MSSKALLHGLNAAQQEAITAPLGNMLVLAGAGSGKTRVLVTRIAWLIKEYQLSPYSILAVTFTNKAAGEMRQRLSTLLSVPVSDLWVGTFHGLCHRLLRRHYQNAGLPEQFHILDSDDQARIVKRAITNLQLDLEQWPVKQAQSFINSKKDEGLRPQHIHAPHFGAVKTLVAIYQAYEQLCQVAGVLDFAELLLRTQELFRDNPDILSHYQQRFQAILVDEFQDTNTIQYAWIRLLAGQNSAVLAVGDDDQSIYGWRGAKVENIRQFSKEFNEVKILRLEQNYRSTSTILQAANALITNNHSRMGKDLWTDGSAGEKISLYAAFNELDEARYISERIAQLINQGDSADEIAILYRSNAQSRVLEDALLRRNIAYRIYGGLRFFERAEVKDALAYLRLVINPDDDSALDRIINFPTRGIGEKTLDELRDYAKSARISLWQAAKHLLNNGEMSQRSGAALARFIDLIEQLQIKTQSLELDEQIEEILQFSGLYAHFGKVKGDKSEARLDNLQELINAARQFRYEENEDEGLPLVSAFLAHASLEAGDFQAKENERSVHLMTLHAAKGLEFPYVFLAGVEEGVFPGKQSIEEPGRMEEERRLCYVGMTRAMQKLIITYAEVRRQYGREEYHKASRFLAEIPDELLEKIRPQARFQPVFGTKNQPGLQRTSTSSGLSVGHNVKHAKFGAGVILAVEGSEAHTRVQVKFSEHGIKWLVLAYADLQQL